MYLEDEYICRHTQAHILTQFYRHGHTHTHTHIYIYIFICMYVYYIYR